MAAEQKVKFGLSKLHFAALTAEGKAEKPWPNIGAKSVSVSNGSSSSMSIAADNNPNFFTKSGGASGKEYEFEVTRFIRDFYTKILGQTKDPTTGALVESVDDVAKQFSAGFEISGDLGGYRVWVLNNSATGVPTYSASTNTDGSLSEASEKLTTKASSIKCNDGKERTVVVFEPGDPGYATAFDAVPFLAATA
ncbi:major tail protein [Lancefieldella rimae]